MNECVVLCVTTAIIAVYVHFLRLLRINVCIRHSPVAFFGRNVRRGGDGNTAQYSSLNFYLMKMANACHKTIIIKFIITLGEIEMRKQYKSSDGAVRRVRGYDIPMVHVYLRIANAWIWNGIPSCPIATIIAILRSPQSHFA